MDFNNFGLWYTLGKMLSSFSSLDRHMLVHSGERPFSCDLCGQTFTTNGNMHRHKRTHGNRESHGNNGNSTGTLADTANGSRGRVGRKRKQPVNHDSLEHHPGSANVVATTSATGVVAGMTPIKKNVLKSTEDR